MVLRAVVPEDAPGVLRSHSDPRLFEFDPHERHSTLAQSERFIAPMVAHWRRYGFGYWSVLVPRHWWPDGVDDAGPDASDRVHAGLGGVQHYAILGEPVLNVYFRLAVEVQGRGLGGHIVTESIRLAAEVAPGIDLVIRTRPANAVARRVAERAGFVNAGLEPGGINMQLLRYTARSGR